MKITFDIPDWAIDGKIIMVSNGRTVLYKNPGIDEPFLVVVTPCGRCGECCLSVGTDWPIGADDEGKCKYLLREGKLWKCTAGPNLPLRCMVPPAKFREPGCAMTFEKQIGK